MDKKEQQSWDECLPLWKKLSETPTQKIESAEVFKDAILNEIGIGERTFGCPFCEFMEDCLECPIYSCKDTSYAGWFIGTVESRKHYKSKAKTFYNYLLKRYEERKAEDN